MKKVLMVRSNPVDPDPRVEKSANALLKAGYEVHILAWDRSDNYKVKKDKKILSAGIATIYRVGCKGEFSGGIKKNLKSLIKFSFAIRKWIKKYGYMYDYIHCYDFDTAFVAFHYVKKLKGKFIYDIADYYIAAHNLSNSKLGKIIKYYEDKLITDSDSTIICSEKRKEQIKDAKPKKLVIIHNTPDDSLFKIDKKSVDNKRDKLKLVYVGVFGTNRMIDIITEVVEKRNDCEFHIGGFGNGMEDYFIKESKDHNNIKYYGKLVYKDTLNLENNCDVLCAIYDPSVPNHYYAAPNKFYEALMLGKPLIMAKNTGMDEIVFTNKIGVVIDYNKQSLEEGINKLIEQKSEWKDMGRRARKLYEECYSWKIMEERLINLYQKL